MVLSGPRWRESAAGRQQGVCAQVGASARSCPAAAAAAGGTQRTHPLVAGGGAALPVHASLLVAHQGHLCLPVVRLVLLAHQGIARPASGARRGVHVRARGGQRASRHARTHACSNTLPRALDSQLGGGRGVRALDIVGGRLHGEVVPARRQGWGVGVQRLGGRRPCVRACRGKRCPCARPPPPIRVRARSLRGRGLDLASGEGVFGQAHARASCTRQVVRGAVGGLLHGVWGALAHGWGRWAGEGGAHEGKRGRATGGGGCMPAACRLRTRRMRTPSPHPLSIALSLGCFTPSGKHAHMHACL